MGIELKIGGNHVGYLREGFAKEYTQKISDASGDLDRLDQVKNELAGILILVRHEMDAAEDMCEDAEFDNLATDANLLQEFLSDIEQRTDSTHPSL